MTSMRSQEDITRLLREVDEGTAGAADRLMQAVYDDLAGIASAQLRRRFGDRAGQLTLEPRALVNESYLRLVRQRQAFDNRGHFFAIATKVMLRVLLDYRRERMAVKRGERVRVSLSLDGAAAEVEAPAPPAIVDIELFEQALDGLERLDPRKAEIVKMRVVWSMTVVEVAEALGISPSSVDRDWRFAKAWIADDVARRERPAPADDARERDGTPGRS